MESKANAYEAMIVVDDAGNVKATILRGRKRFAGMRERTFGPDQKMAEAWARDTLISEYAVEPKSVVVFRGPLSSTVVG